MDESYMPWLAPPPNLSLGEDSVHVWAVSLRASDNALIRFANVLAAEELRRAESFHFDRDRNRFVVGRGTVRMILARYLRAEPENIELEYNLRGKPLLAGRFAGSGLHFNLAHCENLALLAIAPGRVVGVDLERIRAVDGADNTAACFCAPREMAEFQSLPAGERDAAFFRIWTRKEAWLKAVGDGIGESLDKVEVSFQSLEAPRIVRLPGGSGIPASGWSLRELTPAPGFVGALALPGRAPRIGCWKWKMEEMFDYA
jgi:4'-phosphopantetheinyl transferase